MATLVRTLRFKDLTLYIIGSVIGSGIFLTPGAVLRRVDGKIGPALLVWLVGGILSLLGALTYGELSAMKPHAGGLYVYIRDGFGRFTAYMFGWTLFFVIASGTVATLAVAFSSYLSQLVTLGAVGHKLVAVGVIGVIAAINVVGTRQSSDVTNWTTSAKVGGILVMSVALLWLGHGFRGSAAFVWPEQITGRLPSSFGVAMIAVLWAYEGWQYCTYAASETVNPQRDFPRSLLIGSVALIGIYLTANVAYLAALGPAGVAATDSVAAESVQSVVAAWAGRLVAAMILVSIFSAANTTLLGAPRVFYAMATDGVFFKSLARVHPRYETPALAIIVSSVWSAILALSGTFEQLFTYVVFIGWIFYGLAAASIFTYRRREPDALRPYKVPAYPWIPIVFILAACALVINTVITDPKGSLKGIAVVLIGAPVFLIWTRRTRGVAGSAMSSQR
jgi:APA family basic amino acid/polyamine antiporter